MTTTRTEYSIRYRDGQNSAWGNVQYVGGGMFVLPEELPRLQTVLIGTGARLFRRTVLSGESEPVPEPLPTTPGSVISAIHDSHARALFAREVAEFGDDRPWVRLDAYGERWAAGEDMSDVHVLFDAAEVNHDA